MIRLDHTSKSLIKAFGFTTDASIHKLLDFFYFVTTQIEKGGKAFSWAVSRIWIDEMLSDNEKAYLIFSLGRLFEGKKMRDNESEEDE